VWRQGLAEWVDLGSFAELMGTTHIAPPLMPAVPPLPM